MSRHPARKDGQLFIRPFWIVGAQVDTEVVWPIHAFVHGKAQRHLGLFARLDGRRTDGSAGRKPLPASVRGRRRGCLLWPLGSSPQVLRVLKQGLRRRERWVWGAKRPKPTFLVQQRKCSGDGASPVRLSSRF